jgi:hypothetical protein
MTASTISLRHATTDDEQALRRLAALDSTRLGDGPFLVAETDADVVAALSLSDGTSIADPFRHTAELVELLRAHGAARASRERRRRMRPRRALRLAYHAS